MANPRRMVPGSFPTMLTASAKFHNVLELVFNVRLPIQSRVDDVVDDCLRRGLCLGVWSH